MLVSDWQIQEKVLMRGKRNFFHSQECAYDHVVLYDGHTTDSKVLGRFCGSKVPHPVGATSDKMLMVFKSDASVQRRGFSAKHMSGESFHFLGRKMSGKKTLLVKYA